MKYGNFMLATIMLTTTTVANAGKSATEKYGDILQILIPLTGYGATFYMNDTQGRNQFYKSFLTTVAITQGLKLTVHKQRPNGSGSDSFPSGHTSAAFQGAAFIEQRYGWKYGLPAYVAATYVGYSRVKAKQHYSVDVLAGAAIGTLSSYYFTTTYKSITVTPYVENKAAGVNLSTLW